MVNFFKYLLLLPRPRARRLFLASVIPTRLRSTASLESGFCGRTWVCVLQFTVGAAALSILYHVPAAYLPPFATVLVVVLALFLVVTGGWYWHNTRGGGRGFLLRYQSYSEALPAEELKPRGLLLTWDSLASLPPTGMRRLDFHRLLPNQVILAAVLLLTSPMWLTFSSGPLPLSYLLVALMVLAGLIFLLPFFGPGRNLLAARLESQVDRAPQPGQQHMDQLRELVEDAQKRYPDPSWQGAISSGTVSEASPEVVSGQVG